MKKGDPYQNLLQAIFNPKPGLPAYRTMKDGRHAYWSVQDRCWVDKDNKKVNTSDFIYSL